MTDAHEPADARRTPIVIGFAVSLAASLLGTLAVLWILREGRQHVRLMPESERYYQHVPTEVNEVESAAYALPTDAELGAEAARQRLASYGWVDRERQIVHVPIEVAIRAYLLEQGAVP